MSSTGMLISRKRPIMGDGAARALSQGAERAGAFGSQAFHPGQFREVAIRAGFRPALRMPHEQLRQRADVRRRRVERRHVVERFAPPGQEVGAIAQHDFFEGLEAVRREAGADNGDAFVRARRVLCQHDIGIRFEPGFASDA